MKATVELIAALIMVGGLASLMYDRIHFKKGIGVRAIQFLCIVFIVPSILILGLEGILNSEVVATLFGAVIGYVLSGIGKDEPSSR